MAVKIAECYIYPLKSGRAMSVNTLDVTNRGPVNDRIWMLVRDQDSEMGKFITQRDKGCEKLALVSAHPDETGAITFSTDDGGGELFVEQDHLHHYKGTVRIWRDECAAMDAGDKAAQWFSHYLNQPCRLVKIPDDFIRSTDSNYSKPTDQVSFADGFPLLVTNNSSLQKLSKHFTPHTTISMDRFRPNIVLDGIGAFEEDIIHEIKIGNVVLEFVKPCNRCKITTIDQTEGVSPSNEPLKALGQARRGKGGGLQGVFFGQNAIPRHLGTIHAGDGVEIISKKPLHPALVNAVLRPDISPA